MDKNSYARLLGFANTLAGKFVAVIVSVAMIFTLTSAVYAAGEAARAFADDDEVAADEQALPDYAQAHFTAQNCTIELAGQPVSGSVAVSPGSDLAFTVVPLEGFLLSSVYASDELGGLPLETSENTCVVAGDFVYGDIYVEAIAAEDPDNPQDSTPVTPISDDTVINDGQTIPDPLYAAPTVVLNDTTRPYNGLPIDTTTVDVSGLVEGDEILLSFEGSQTDVGSSAISVASYSIWRGDVDATSLYEAPVFQPATITVEPATLRIFTPSATKTYDGSALVYEGSFDEGDMAVVEELWGEDQVAFSLTGNQTDVGSSPNTYSLEWLSGNPANYTIVEDIGTLTVLPAAEAVYAIAPSASKTYDGAPIDAGPVSWTGLPEGFTAQAEYSGAATDTSVVVTSVEAQSVRILDASGADVTANFEVATIDGELVVEPASLSVFTESAFKTDDGAPLTADGAIGGFVNGETATFSVTGVQEGVGSSTNTYRIDWDGTANQANYQVFEDLGTLEIFEAAVEGDDPNAASPVSPEPAGGNASGDSADGAAQSSPAADTPASEDAPAAADDAPSVATVPAETVASPAATASAPAATAAAAPAAASAASGDGINPVVEALATGMQNIEQVATGEAPTELAAPAVGRAADEAADEAAEEDALEEEILADDETPLGVFDEPVDCWVHWYTILGLVATAVYAGVVMFFRRAYSYELEQREAAVLGAPTGTAPAHVPASQGGKAGKEA